MTDFQNPRPSVGIGLRSKYLEYFLADIPQIPIGWLEVHPENYIYHYPNRQKLQRISERFPISFHCVSLSLGSPELPPPEYLGLLKQLMLEINPFIVSDHLAWNTLNGYAYNDLYPMPLTESSLKHISLHVSMIQDYFQRQLLIENPSTYLQFQDDTINEYDFLNALATNTGCGIVLDVNNLYVQSVNHGWDIQGYLKNLHWKHVKEIHLGGHLRSKHKTFLIDTHSQPVIDEVWSIYKQALRYKQQVLSLIEWDHDLPEIEVLLGEARKALTYMDLVHAEEPV